MSGPEITYILPDRGQVTKALKEPITDEKAIVWNITLEFDSSSRAIDE